MDADLSVSFREADMIQTRDQKIANTASRCIEKRSFDEDYRTVALNFPVLVMRAGLAQALGFLSAKGKTDYLSDLSEVLAASTGIRLENGIQEEAMKCPIEEYRRMTREVLAASAWMKRIVQAKEK